MLDNRLISCHDELLLCSVKLPGFSENVVFLSTLHSSFFEGGDEFQLENSQGLDEVLSSKVSECFSPE